MFEVKVTVELPGIPDALNNLARAIAENGFAKTVNAVEAKAETDVPTITTTPATVPAHAPVAAPAEQPAPVQQPVAPAPVTAPVVAPVEQPTPIQPPVAPASAPTAGQPEETFTMNDLSVAGAKLVEQGKMDAVVTLLQRFGVAAITQLKEAQYADFAKSLRAMGASI